MKLSEIVDSDEWNDEIKEIFFKKLKRSPSDFHKSQNCLVKAYNIAKTEDKEKVKEAINLVDYVIKNFSDETHSLQRAYSLKGNILEYYLRDFKGAFECYNKWSQIGSTLAGHDFEKLRVWIRYSKLKPNTTLYDLIKNLEKTHLPSKEFRFWTSVATSIVYSNEGDYEEAKRYARSALVIYSENNPTVLQQMLIKHKNISDNLDITDEELNLIRTIAKKGKV